MILLWLSRYVFCCSYSHNVAPKGKFIAFVSTEAETDNPETELKPGIDLLGPVDEIFFDIYDRYEPVNEPSLDNSFISTVGFYECFLRLKYLSSFYHYRFTLTFVFILQSYDATTHFESTVLDVLNMYTLITGKVICVCLYAYILSCLVKFVAFSPFTVQMFLHRHVLRNYKKILF